MAPYLFNACIAKSLAESFECIVSGILIVRPGFWNFLIGLAFAPRFPRQPLRAFLKQSELAVITTICRIV